MAKPPKKRELRTIRAPLGLPKKNAVTKKADTPVREVKTVKGEVIRESPKKLAAPRKMSGTRALPAPDNLRPDLLPKAKKVGGQLLKRAGALGTAITIGSAIHSALTSPKKKEEAKTPNVASTGQSTKIEITKKPVKPTKKPTSPKPKESFGKAFAAARKAGKKEFEFQGKRFHTRTKEEETRRKKNVAQEKGRKAFEKKFL